MLGFAFSFGTGPSIHPCTFYLVVCAFVFFDILSSDCIGARPSFRPQIYSSLHELVHQPSCMVIDMLFATGLVESDVRRSTGLLYWITGQQGSALSLLPPFFSISLSLSLYLSLPLSLMGLCMKSFPSILACPRYGSG